MGKFQFWLPKKPTPKQRRAIDSNNDIFLTGVPGSGKTVVSIFRLKNTNSGILFTLGKLLRKTIEEKVDDKSKKIVNIHAWSWNLQEKNNRRYLKYCLSDENLTETISFFKSKGVHYDEIIVDEGQDLTPNSYKLFKSISNNISVSADDAQQINNKEEASDEKDILDILPNLEKYELDEIFRSAYELYDFARQFVPYNARANDKNMLERLKRKDFGADKPFVYMIPNLSDTYDIIRDIIDDNPTDNIGILCEKTETIDECVEKLQNDCEISFYHSNLAPEQQKKILNSELKNIIVTTIKSAKGIEFDIVIIHEFQNATKEKAEEYFVGVTRAKSQVHLISVGNTPRIINDFDASTYKLIDRR